MSSGTSTVNARFTATGNAVNIQRGTANSRFARFMDTQPESSFTNGVLNAEAQARFRASEQRRAARRARN